MTWDSYAGELAELAQWKPTDVVGRDVLAQVKETGAAWAVTFEGVRRLRELWRAFPEDVRSQALAALDQVTDQIGVGLESVEGVPIAAFVAAAVKAVVGIIEAVREAGGQKQSGSDFALAAARRDTLAQLQGGSHGIFSVVPVFEYAEFIRVRAGGDFQRRPCFRRDGGHRDAIFTGVPTPGDTGNCDKEMRRSGSDSYGPFSPKCGHQLGLSALFYPWWSTTYSPGPLPRFRWRESRGGFDAGLSTDNNTILVGEQARLLTDPAANAQAELGRVDQVVDNLLAWWEGAGELVPIRREGKNLVAWEPTPSWYEARGMPQGHRPRIDASQRDDHVPSSSASSYWYRAPGGTIVAYPNQPNADPDTWGKTLPAGDPAELAVSVAMLSGVVATRSAFAARRLATIRDPQLAQALIQDHGLGALDPGARAALRHASKQSSLLPYPGVITPKRAFARKAVIPKRPGDGGGGAVLVLAAAAALALSLKT